MIAIIGLAAMVFDASNIFSNKTRLQNILDSTALTAAKVLDDTYSQSQARTAAQDVFDENINQAGNKTLKDVGLSSADLTIQFSDTRNPFIASPAATRFARVRINSGTTKIKTIFMGVFGIKALDLSGSALAGPTPALGTVCNVVPTVVCGDPDIPPDAQGMYGYKYGDQVSLVMGSTKNNNVGPGNFQLLDLSALTDDKSVRNGLAGGSNACVSSTGTVDTKPGVNRGPVAQGFNTRFGIYSGPVNATDYPPDKVTDAGNAGYPDSYANYTQDYATKNYDEQNGVSERRVMAVAFGNCTGTVNGAGSVPLLGFGCVFLNSPATQNGALQSVQVTGELIRSCSSSGVPGPSPVDGPGVHSIQLYGDPDRWDS